MKARDLGLIRKSIILFTADDREPHHRTASERVQEAQDENSPGNPHRDINDAHLINQNTAPNACGIDNSAQPNSAPQNNSTTPNGGSCSGGNCKPVDKN